MQQEIINKGIAPSNLKIRLQGNSRDIIYFVRVLKANKEFQLTNVSDLMDIKCSNRNKRLYCEANFCRPNAIKPIAAKSAIR